MVMRLNDGKQSVSYLNDAIADVSTRVHGMEASYNDVPQWKYSKIPEVLTPEGSKHPKTWKIRTRAELEELLEDRAFQEGKGLQVSPIPNMSCSAEVSKVCTDAYCAISLWRCTWIAAMHQDC